MTDRTTRRTAMPLLWLPVLVMMTANLASGQEPTKEYAKDFHQNFQGAPPNPKDLALLGPDAAKHVKFEAEGLRITLPTGYVGERPSVGVATGFAVRGDFEITVEFEILQEPAPAGVGKLGTRLTLMIILNTPSKNMATLARKAYLKGSEYAAWRMYSKDEDSPNQTGSKALATTAKSGRLRLVRRAATLSYYIADGADPEFKLLTKFPIREDDVKEVRVIGTTGGDQAALDARVTNLRIRADELPAAAVNPQGAAPPKLTERVEYRFRDGITKQPLLRLFGDGIDEMAVVEPQGLRLNLPADRGYRGDVGLESRLRLKGDFETTLEYELLVMPNPGPELGAGAILQVLLDTPDAFKARMGRSRKAAGARFSANYITRGPDGKDKFNGLTAPPANDKETKGHLRMVRAGNKLSYQVEEGGTGFRTIATKQVEFADVIAVQAICATGWQPVKLEVCFPRLELRSTEMPNNVGSVIPVVEPNPPEPDMAPEERDWNVTAAPTASGVRSIFLLVIGIGAVVSLAMIVGLVVFLMRRKRVADRDSA